MEGRQCPDVEVTHNLLSLLGQTVWITSSELSYKIALVWRSHRASCKCRLTFSCPPEILGPAQRVRIPSGLDYSPPSWSSRILAALGWVGANLSKHGREVVMRIELDYPRRVRLLTIRMPLGVEI